MKLQSTQCFSKEKIKQTKDKQLNTRETALSNEKNRIGFIHFTILF